MGHGVRFDNSYPEWPHRQCGGFLFCIYRNGLPVVTHLFVTRHLRCASAVQGVLPCKV